MQGCLVKLGHNSATYTCTSPVHLIESNRADILGGSTRNQPQWQVLGTNLEIKIKQINSLNSSQHTPLVQKKFLYSGWKSHFLKTEDLCEEVKNVTEKLTVTVPNGEIICTNKQGILHIPALSKRSQRAHILDKLLTSILLVGQMCDDGCVVTFENT